MPHYCKICMSYKANEKFSGKGHRLHICKQCSKLPKEERNNIMAGDEITGFLFQSNISEKNISKLRKLCKSENEEIKELATLVLETAMVHPRKKRRLTFLAENRRDLLDKLEKRGLIF